jgi:hypothetical protein
MIGCLSTVAVIFLAAFFLDGMVWLSNRALPWLNAATGIALAICILVLVPLSLFSRTRAWAGSCYYACSFVFGATLFAYACIVAYLIWGYSGLGLGLLFAGIGVVPVAYFATIFHGYWHECGELIFGTVLTFTTRAFGLYLVSKSSQRTESNQGLTKAKSVGTHDYPSNDKSLLGAMPPIKIIDNVVPQPPQSILVIDRIPGMADFWAEIFSDLLCPRNGVIALHCATQDDEDEAIRHVKSVRFKEVYVGTGPELAVRIKQASPETNVILICGNMTRNQRQVLNSSGYHFQNLLEPSDSEAPGGEEHRGPSDQVGRDLGLTVLVVDGEFTIAEAVKAHVTENGHNVLDVCCREHADIFKVVDQARWMRFDVAFIGSHMPCAASSMAGYLKLVSPATRIVFIAKQISEKDAASLRIQGIEFDTITVPVIDQEISDLLGKYQIAGPLACEDEPALRGSTGKIMLAHADNLERRARLLDIVSRKMREKMDGRDVEITDEDIPF